MIIIMMMIESENKGKFLDLGKEVKKLRNIKVMVIPIVISALGIVTKGLVQELEDEWTLSKLQHY